MDIRKLIKEEIESLFNGGNVINGMEIVNYLKDLPETRDEVNWSNPRTFYTIPTIDNSFANTEVLDKEFFTGWNRPYMRQGKSVPSNGEGYISEFQRVFGEQPIFKINGRNIDVLNPKFKEGRKNSEFSNPHPIQSFGTTD